MKRADLRRADFAPMHADREPMRGVLAPMRARRGLIGVTRVAMDRDKTRAVEVPVVNSVTSRRVAHPAMSRRVE